MGAAFVASACMGRGVCLRACGSSRLITENNKAAALRVCVTAEQLRLCHAIDVSLRLHVLE